MKRDVFVVLYARGPVWVEGIAATEQPSVAEHVKHREALGDRLIGASFFEEDRNDPTVGMVILLAPGRGDAEQWASKDPSVIARVMKAKVHRWEIDRLQWIPEAR